LPRNVIALVERPRDAIDDADTQKSWTVAEVETFRESVRDERLFACWLLNCYGLRRSEVLSLRWSHLDGDVLRIPRGRVAVGNMSEEGNPKPPRGSRNLPPAARSHRGVTDTQDQADLRRRGSHLCTAVMLVGLKGFEPATT
jgi:integrase